MGFLSSFFQTDPQLGDLDKQIEGIVASVPIKDFPDNTSEDSPSELIHQFLASEDKYANKEDLKKNNVFSNLIDDKQQTGGMTDVGLLLDKLTVQADRASRYKT